MNTDYNIQKSDEYACVIVGDEILNGHVEERNLRELIDALYPLGYMLQEVRIVSDEVEFLSRTISELRKIHNLVITIGGLGATHDDRTMEAYAKSFQQELVLHKEMYDFLHRRPRSSREMQDAVERMSRMPKDIEIIQLDDRWPVIKLGNCFALPGLPSICKLTIEKLITIFPKQASILYQECYVNVREHHYFTWLEELSKQWNTVSIGSYPIQEKEDIVSKISVTGKDKAQVDACFRSIIDYFSSQGVLIS